MLRRLSSRFGKKREEPVNERDQQTATQTNGIKGDHASNGINGNNGATTEAVNGRTNGVRNGMNGQRKSSYKPQQNTAIHEENQTVDRADVDSSFKAFAQLVHASQRPLPNQSGDGTYIDHEDHHTGLWTDLRTMGFKDAKTLAEALRGAASGELQDDKTMLMERVIQLVSGFPQTSKTRVDLTNAFVNQLWSSLEHPPQSYLGKRFQYRSANGSNNNTIFPQLGAANQYYARSVPPLTIQPGALPDAGVVFDSIYARETYRPHPNNVSSVLFYWASIIIHDLFSTDHTDINKSKTSSYLDLSPLYGDTQAEQDTVRTFKDGKLKADSFAGYRLLSFPPGCGVILIMFNRFHNYVVEQLATINEGGRFTKPKEGLDTEQAKAAWATYDNDLFQTGRLITCGLYINITLLDYLRTIVNLNRSNTTWTLDPRVDTPKGIQHIDRGNGNQVSAEFNLVYRWHSCISARDEKWTEEAYQEMFGKSSEEVSMMELMAGLKKWAHSLNADPQKRSFAHLERGADGKFDDDDLVKIMTESIEDCAGAFGANNVPKVLRAVEVMGIEQARHWQLGSLNEFRKFFGLAPHETFESINKDPKVAEHLRHLYEHPDFVEMYPGIVCEDEKEPMVPGVGICPPYTISRAILSDAVVLVRGDRFYTTDYNPKNLTNWGYNEVQYDLNIEQGCVFYKLFLRAFPNHFKPDSVYAHYPMTIPSDHYQTKVIIRAKNVQENMKILTNLGRVDHYSFDRPAAIPPRVNLTSYVGAKFVLERPQDFTVIWGPGFERTFGPRAGNFMLSGDGPFFAKQKQLMGQAIYKDKWHQQVKDFYEHITLKLLHEKSYSLAGVNEVDITRDVGNLAHIHFASDVFFLPLKTEEHPRGIYTEHEMYQLMALMFIAIFFDLDPAKSFPLRLAAKTLVGALCKVVEGNVKAVNATGWIHGLVDGYMSNKSYLTEYGVHMVRQLLATGMDANEATYEHIMPTAGAMVANQAQVFTQIIDFFLSDKGKVFLPDLNRLAKMDTTEADDKIMHYAMEAIRLNGTFGLYRQAQTTMTVNDDGREVRVKAGDNVFVSFVGAAKDAKVFPNPEEVDITRPLDSYIHYGVGTHQCIGMQASRVALTAMLKTVGKLDNLRRAPGPRGQLKKIPREGGFYIYMREDHGAYFPFPTTMRINWDGRLPPVTSPTMQKA